MQEFNDKIIIKNNTTNQEQNAQVIACFSLSETNKTYMLYRTGKVDNGYEIVSASELRGETLYNVDPNEWPKVKEAMKQIIAEVSAWK